MDERWKDIPGFEGRYQVSDLGRVKSVACMQRGVSKSGKEYFHRKKEKIVSLNLINSGYFIVHLYLNNVRYWALVHRLVAEAFVEGFASTVNHKDADKKNNAAANLEWMSMSENHFHAVENGLKPMAIRVVGKPISGGAVISFGSISQALAHFSGSNGGQNPISECIAGRRESAYDHAWARA